MYCVSQVLWHSLRYETRRSDRPSYFMGTSQVLWHSLRYETSGAAETASSDRQVAGALEFAQI